MKKRIHVNQQVIKRNRATGSNEPPITVKAGRTNVRAHAVEIHGPSMLVYRPMRPLDCGAVLWIETDAPITTHKLMPAAAAVDEMAAHEADDEG